MKSSLISIFVLPCLSILKKFRVHLWLATFHMNKISKELFHFLDPFSSKCPRFYGAPKLHKPNIPLRLIVDFRNSPSYNLAAHLNKILHPLTDEGKCVMKNSVDFVNKCRTIKVKRGFCPVSFDVKSLFTKVPIQHTLSILKSRLSEDSSWKTSTKLELPDIVMLTELCMEGNFFQFSNKYYEQCEGAAMGSPISPVFAEFLLQDLEHSIIPSMRSILH